MEVVSCKLFEVLCFLSVSMSVCVWRVTDMACCTEVIGLAVEPLMMILGGEEEQQTTAASVELAAESPALLPLSSLMPVLHRSEAFPR